MSQSYEELNKFIDADVKLFIRNYDDYVLEKEDIQRRINELRGMKRNQLEENELKNLYEKLSTLSQEIDETYKPERDLAVRILQERSQLKSKPSAIASSALASAVLASIASKGKSSAVEPQQEISALFEHPKYTHVKPEVEPQKEKSTKDVASSSKQASEKAKNELKLYNSYIYKMFLNHSSDDDMYKVMKSYSTEGIKYIIKKNKVTMIDYEENLDKKVMMDMRKGAKRNVEYGDIVYILNKNKDKYSFVKRTQPIVEKILKEKQQIEMGTDPIKEMGTAPIKDYEKGTIDIEKLKDLIKTHPSFKDIIGKTALSEMVRTGKADKQSLDDMKDFFKQENVQSRIVIPKNQTTPDYVPRKPLNLEDYGELIPPRFSIIRA